MVLAPCTLGNINVPPNFVLTFTVTPFSVVPQYTSIIHFSIGESDGLPGNRVPGIWFNPNSTQLYIAFDGKGYTSFGKSLKNQLPLGVASKIDVSAVGNIVTISVNDVFMDSFHTPDYRFSGVAALYASDIFTQSANAKISEIHVSAVGVETSYNAGSTLPWKPLVISNLGVYIVPPDFELTIGVTPFSTKSTWTSLLHFSIDGQDNSGNSRIPGVWFLPHSTQLYVGFDGYNYTSVGVLTTFVNPKLIVPMNQYSVITILAVGSRVTVSINGIIGDVFTLPGPRKTGAAVLYASDPFVPPANIILSVIILETKTTTPGATACTGDAEIPPTKYLDGTFVIKVFTQGDVYKRLGNSTKVHVTLEIQNDINGVNWNFNSSFSNTTIVSKCGVPVVLKSFQNVTPISVYNARDFFIHNVVVQSFYDANNTFKCKDDKLVQYNVFNTIKYDINYTPICPCVLFAHCINVQVVGSSFHGKIILYNTSDTYLDGNHVTTFGLDWGIFTGYIGNWYTLAYPQTVIRNNVIHETNTGILVAGTTGPSIGIQIINNNITSFKWASVQFGYPASHGAQHCLMANNFIYVPDSYTPSFEASYVFLNTFWTGFNNTIKHNYFKQNKSGTHGFYMAMGTSGTTITDNILDGVLGVPLKLHTGKYNNITRNLMYKTGPIWPIQCIFSANQDNCGNKQYYIPWAFGNNNFSSAGWKNLIPYANGQPREICNLKEIDGIKCNPTESDNEKYYNCSGIPWKNIVHLTTVKAHNFLNFTLPLEHARVNGTSCNGDTNAPNVDLLNVWSDVNFPDASVFRDLNGFLRVEKTSILAQTVPEFMDFPYDEIGAKSTRSDFFRGIKP